MVLAPFFQNQILLRALVRYNTLNNQMKLVRDGQVEYLPTLVWFVGATTRAHEPVDGYTVNPSHHTLF